MRREHRAFSRVGRSSGVVLVYGAFWQGLWGKGWRAGVDVSISSVWFLEREVI